jgi:hypothetical protein
MHIIRAKSFGHTNLRSPCGAPSDVSSVMKKSAETFHLLLDRPLLVSIGFRRPFNLDPQSMNSAELIVTRECA